MKRGKDDEKIMGPMFPRLHVNDTGKGGPRPPPRNKMALYEQLSIPSQRFSPGVLPLNPSNTSNSVPPGSSSQGSSLEKRNMNFPSHLSSSTSTTLAEKFNARQLGSASVNAHLAHLEQRKKVRDDDDFMVPVFVNSETRQQCNKTKNVSSGEKLTPLSSTYSGRPINIQNPRDQDPNWSSSTSDAHLRNEGRHQNKESPRVLPSREHSVKTYADLSTREKTDGQVEEVNVSPNHGCTERHASTLSRMHENDPCSPQDLRNGRQPTDVGCIDVPLLMRDTVEGILPLQRSISYSDGNHSVPDEGSNGNGCQGDKTHGSQRWANGDKSDVSETSMVDSVSGLDISPDDVVGIIGQKRFWKARRAIANQQRVFAVQVFELHRLIKVQRLIAESPHMLLEDTAYLSKPSFKSSPAKKLPTEFIVKPLPHTNLKDDTEKESHKMECSAENALGRTSLSSVKNGSQPPNYGPFPGNQLPTPVHSDNKMNPWCFPQMPGHQWLVPVMSPSEGLVYKPYLGPGFMGSVCGGCGPFGQTPTTGNFMTSAYGVPALPHQGFGVLPGGHSYFPPYGMPVMSPAVSGSAVEQMNQFAAPGFNSHNGQFSGGGANFNMQYQSSCNLPSEKNGTISHVMQHSKDTELQGSSASSPGERVQRERSSAAATTAERKNALPLFPTAPLVPEGGSQSQDIDHRTRVIKVVPHNPRSATESAARIFLSIQQERNQYDSV